MGEAGVRDQGLSGRLGEIPAKVVERFGVVGGDNAFITGVRCSLRIAPPGLSLGSALADAHHFTQPGGKCVGPGGGGAGRLALRNHATGKERRRQGRSRQATNGCPARSEPRLKPREGTHHDEQRMLHYR